MIQLIVGEKGKGKTKHLLEKVNAAAKTSNGNIVYLDKNSKHMYELNNKIRLINASEFPISSEEEFVGFVCGIVSQDHDLEQVYFDSFMDIAYIKDRTKVEDAVKKLDKISEQFKVDFVISVSLDSSELSEYLQPKVIVSL
ncbi:MAG: twitching motility protein PilT [Lachnospiraceae bacterium]|nr:twitching motility protein PilT [Lachnospiraceae bacterium]MBR6469170.1 twitching motility protein PilT [Lachnospiraceae bacterium]